MIIAAILFAYAVLLSTLVPRLLRGGHWAERAPRLGIVVWQVLGVSALTAAVLAGLALTVPTVRVSADLAELLQACVMALAAQYASPAVRPRARPEPCWPSRFWGVRPGASDTRWCGSTVSGARTARSSTWSGGRTPPVAWSSSITRNPPRTACPDATAVR